MQPLRLAGVLVHVERQALRRAVIQPLFDGEAVALGLGDLLPLGIEEQFVIEAGGRIAAQRAHDLARQDHAVDQILAGHFIIDTQRQPAHRPIHLPLQLAVAAGDGNRDRLARAGADIGDRAGRHIAVDDRHLQHGAQHRIDRQERRIGGAPFGAERGQDDAHHIVIMGQYLQQRRIEHAAGVAFGGRHELVIKAEAVEKGAQPGVVVLTKAGVGAERVAHFRQRLAQVLAQHFRVRNAVRHLAQPVHIVGKGDQAGLDARRHGFKGAAHHGGAHHFAKGADVRQARRAIAGFKDHRLPGGHAIGIAGEDLAGFLERPCLVFEGSGLQGFGGDGHGFWLSLGFAPL